VLVDVIEFLASVNWVRVFVTIVGTAIAVFFGIWVPARLFETYTGQVAVRYVWFVAGGMMLVMIYISLFGYGNFWTMYVESGAAEELRPMDAE